MAYRHVDLLKVSAWGRFVGAVAIDPRQRAFVFEYDPVWRRSGIELAPASMPLTRRGLFSFPNLPKETYYGLPPMLADSVPDNFGNSIINASLAREGVAAEDVTALDRLAYVGSRGMGALVYEPDTGPGDEQPTPIALAELVVAARAAVEGTLVDEPDRTEVLSRLLAVGTSAGGARAKAVIAWNKATNEMRAGNLPAPAGFEQWLLKFDGVGGDPVLGDGQPFGRIEYAYSLMAQAAGITMAATELLEEGGRAHFVTRRFDFDESGERLHMQSLCALDSLDFNQTGTHDYASYLLRCLAFGLDSDALEQVFRRMVFNVVASNNDDHTKNFAFLADSEGTWRLAPAYDLTFSWRADSPWVNRHQMSIDGKFENIGLDDLLRVADRFNIPNAKAAVREVQEVVAAWPGFAAEARVPRSEVARIQQRLTDVAVC